MNILVKSIVYFISFIIIYNYISSPSVSKSDFPNDQKKFVDLILKHTDLYYEYNDNQRKNESLKSKREGASEVKTRYNDEHIVRIRRMNALANFLKGNYYIKSWVGIIEDVDVSNEQLVIKISSSIEIITESFTKGTNVYNHVINLPEGQEVIFSGVFIPSTKDYIKEGSITIGGTMVNPEFLFTFESVRSYD